MFFSDMERRVFVRLIFYVALTVTLYATTDRMEHPAVTQINDKLAHAGTFFVLAWLLDAGWPQRPLVVNKVLILTCYGLIIEIIQYFLPWRSFSLLDWLADGLGVMLYFLVLAPFFRRFLQQARH